MGWLCRAGHVASSSQFAERGVSRRALSQAVADGRIVRLRVGVYACPHLTGDLRDAATAGLQLDCVSWLEQTPKQWTGRRAHGLHLYARGGRHHAALPDAATVHWSRHEHGGTLGALSRAVACLDPYDWLAAVESAIHLGAIGEGAAGDLRPGLPAPHAAALARLDTSSHSGFETFTRCQLVDAGHRVETQVPVPGTSDLDLLVDGVVGVETDGRRWHDERFTADRTKDIVVEGWGVRVLRIGEIHIFEEWPRTLATIERMIDDALRARMHTRAQTRR